MMSVDDYLAIPREYGEWLGGLRWSPNREVVEFIADEPEIGPTFAFSIEIARFLGGAAGDGSFPHFAHLLHLMDLLGFGLRRGENARLAPRLSGPFVRFARAFRESGRNLRNAGALCARLCAGVPGVPDPPAIEDVEFGLVRRVGDRGGKSPKDRPVAPSIAPRDFENRVENALRPYFDAELESWFRHGRGPLREAGERVSRAVPQTLAEVLTALDEHPRLKGSGAIATRLAGALGVPPRRLSPAELPIGGYADVTTRGRPEQILPTQFALDTDEFLRRFAERELLYYHREEPKTPTARSVTLVIDQGVRTWGNVRLILAAAAMALAGQAERRGQVPRFAATSRDGPAIDASSGVEMLGSVLSASDLGANPAKTLGRVLLDVAEESEPRDIVLLTHPRNLGEPEVQATARRAGPETRLFAVAVDAEGAVEFSELKDGLPVVMTRCRVDASDRPPVQDSRPKPRIRASGRDAWSGDVEPVGFPFRVGPTERIDDHLFAFDDAGQWLMIAGRDGLLRTYRVDGSDSGMAPRGYHHGELLTTVEAVVGVAGGFVVIGAPTETRRLAAHYDVRTRTCVVHELRRCLERRLAWTYNRRCHFLVGHIGPMPFTGLDLGEDAPGELNPSAHPVTARSRDFWRDWINKPDWLAVAGDQQEVPDRGRFVFLHAETGVLTIRAAGDEQRSFRLMTDGKPCLALGRLLTAVWHGETLGVIVDRRDGVRNLYVFTVWGDWRLFGEYVLPRDCDGFAMTRDGRRVAWRSGEGRVLVIDLERAGPPSLVVSRGRVHSKLEVELGRNFFAIQAGRHAHVIRWDANRLSVHHSECATGMILAGLYLVEPGHPPTRLTPHARSHPYVLSRFYASTRVGLLFAGVDRMGQVAILNHAEDLVAIFFVFRSHLAAWLPDGTVFGPASITGRSQSTDAEFRIADAIREAASPRKELGRRITGTPARLGGGAT